MPYTAKQVSILQNERTNDPLARSYSGMSDVQFLTSIETEDRVNARTTLSAGEIFEQIDPAEFVALSNAETVRVDRVLSLGAEIVVGPGNSHQAVQEFIATFGVGSVTMTALESLRDQLFSRVEELGLPLPILADVQRTT